MIQRSNDTIKQSVDKSSYKIAFVALIVTAAVVGSTIYSNPTLFKSSTITSTMTTTTTKTQYITTDKNVYNVGDTCHWTATGLISGTTYSIYWSEYFSNSQSYYSLSTWNATSSSMIGTFTVTNDMQGGGDLILNEGYGASPDANIVIWINSLSSTTSISTIPITTTTGTTTSNITSGTNTTTTVISVLNVSSLISSDESLNAVMEFQGWNATQMASYGVYTQLRYLKEENGWLNIYTVDPNTTKILSLEASESLQIPDPTVKLPGYFWFIDINADVKTVAPGNFPEAGTYYDFWVDAVNATVVYSEGPVP
ncbi:MAG: hypothetical protein ABSB40_09120 [Nitrososphaeria archaeon]